MAASAVIGGLVLTSCAPEGTIDDDDAEPQPQTSAAAEPAEPSTPEPAESEEEVSEPDEPEVVAEDGFWRANTLPEPVAEAELARPTEDSGNEPATAKLEVLSLDRDDQFARLVLAWLPPEQGEALDETSISSYRSAQMLAPWARLVDRENQQMWEPLRGEGRTFDTEAPPAVDEGVDAEAAPGRSSCVCSAVRGSSSGGDDRTKLIYVDFPAPEGDEMDLLVGQWAEPLRDIPVTEGEPFELPDDEGVTYFDMRDSSQEFPTDVYGAGATYAHAAEAIGARSRSLTGLTTTVEGESQEVSIPSDVLFEFGEYSLGSEAEEVIVEVAEKLNDEAAGESVVVEGHTDNVDGHDVNQPLSENRAEAVTEALGPALDDSITIETEGHSFNEPLVPNEDAEGNDIPDNRELNRRVSFRYTFTETSEVSVDLGFEEIDDLPEGEELETSEGAVASYAFEAPEEDRTSEAVRLDLVEAEPNEDGGATLRLGLAQVDDDAYTADVFQGAAGSEEPQHFGKNPYSAHFDPGLGNLSILDPEAGEEHFPLTAGETGCLCTEVAGSGTALAGIPASMFAEFSLPDEVEGPLILRVPDAGQVELPEEIVEQLSAGATDPQDDESADQ